LLVASVSVVPVLTVSVPAKFSPLVATVTTGVVPVITARFPICAAVFTVPVPLIWIVELVGLLKGPEIDTDPLAVIVFTAVLVTPPVPLLVNAPQSKVPEVSSVPAVSTLNAFAPAFTVPPLWICSVPPLTWLVTPFSVNVTPLGTANVPPITDRVPEIVIEPPAVNVPALTKRLPILLPLVPSTVTEPVVVRAAPPDAAVTVMAALVPFKVVAPVPVNEEIVTPPVPPLIVALVVTDRDAIVPLAVRTPPFIVMLPEPPTVPALKVCAPMASESAAVVRVRLASGLVGLISKVTGEPLLTVAESPATVPGTPLGVQFVETLQLPEPATFHV